MENEENEILDDLEQRFETYEEEYLKFERIPEKERRHHRLDLCGMIYLDEKLGGNERIISAAQHDEIALYWPYETLEKLTDEDIIYITRCGFMFDEISRCISSFV